MGQFSEQKVAEGFPEFFYYNDKTFKFSSGGQRMVIYVDVANEFTKVVFTPEMEAISVPARIEEAYATGGARKK